MRASDTLQTRAPRDRSRVATFLLLLLAVIAAQTGCSREFFREWANQDVSETVYEKSRDPRWRLDLFTVEPPAISRHSNPYDPDRPPAPPDDRASEALSPVPQWPDNRLLVPAEGTGYLDMLDAWQRQQTPYVRPPLPESFGGNYFGYGRRPAVPAPLPEGTEPPPPVPGSASPFRPPGSDPDMNSGPGGAPLTPIPVPGSTPAPSAGPGGPQTNTRPRDPGVAIVAFQQSGIPLPVPTPTPEGARPGVPSDFPAARDVKVPPIGLDPAPNLEGSDLAAPVNPRPDLTPDQYRASEAVASELAGILVPQAISFDEAQAAGLPRSITPYVLTMDQALTLAIINGRVYQFNLENIYLTALAVTLQRFAFTPQFYAGLSPTTGVAGGRFAANSFPNQFTYSTRATGAQASGLSIGTVAGVGKLFNSGAQVLAGFANQVVFNFIGKNSMQPRVQSLLPLTITQPFLSGGGRAVTLEALTQAERNLVYQLRAFALFRQQYTVATLIGGSVPNFGSAVPSLGFTGGGNSDPITGFVNIVEDIQLVENYIRNIAAYEQIVKVYKELIKGESSGLSQLQLDQVEQGLLGAKQSLVTVRVSYRNDLDNFKQQLGLPPDTPLMPDRRLTRRFKEAFAAVDEWQANPRRDLKDLPAFAERLPKLEDIVLDGRSVLGVYSEGKNDEEKLEDLLLASERIMMEHRLDLMNARGALYDTWRQIKVNANALQGVFTLAMTNQFVTPPTTTNPFGFLDQAKQFSLVMNAELPLVRLAQRNNFRSALISYDRQRRSLMNTEDSLKNIIRQDIRAVHQWYLTYEITKRNFILTVRLKDQAFEQIIAPPAGAAAGASQAPLQTTNLIQFQQSLINNENQLVTAWYQYQIQRLELYRDLGTLPFEEWEAFRELFPDEPFDAAVPPTPGNAGPARTAAAPAEREAETVGR